MGEFFMVIWMLIVGTVVVDRLCVTMDWRASTFPLLYTCNVVLIGLALVT